MANPHARTGGKRRYRLQYDPKADRWHCIRLNGRGEEIGRSPAGTADEAEGYERTMRRYGAWTRS
jgi:hypothetical protein